MAEGQGSGRGGGCSCGSEQLGIGRGEQRSAGTPWSGYGRSLARRKIEEARAWWKAAEQELKATDEGEGKEGGDATKEETPSPNNGYLTLPTVIPTSQPLTESYVARKLREHREKARPSFEVGFERSEAREEEGEDGAGRRGLLGSTECDGGVDIVRVERRWCDVLGDISGGSATVRYSIERKSSCLKQLGSDRWCNDIASEWADIVKGQAKVFDRGKRRRRCGG